MRTSRIVILAVCLGCAAFIVSCPGKNAGENAPPMVEGTGSPAAGVALVTFIELGSVNCIPCRAMQPIMRDVEREFGGQVKVVFHDVKTDEGAPYAQQYGIRAIPTQVFLDKDGNEYFRHEGYFPKADLIEVLKRQGVRQ